MGFSIVAFVADPRPYAGAQAASGMRQPPWHRGAASARRCWCAPRSFNGAVDRPSRRARRGPPAPGRSARCAPSPLPSFTSTLLWLPTTTRSRTPSPTVARSAAATASSSQRCATARTAAPREHGSRHRCSLAPGTRRRPGSGRRRGRQRGAGCHLKGRAHRACSARCARRPSAE